MKLVGSAIVSLKLESVSKTVLGARAASFFFVPHIAFTHI